MDKCVEKALLEKFNINFSENIKTFSDNVQKFGWFELVFNVVSKEITIKKSSPVGTPKESLIKDRHSRQKHVKSYLVVLRDGGE